MDPFTPPHLTPNYILLHRHFIALHQSWLWHMWGFKTASLSFPRTHRHSEKLGSSQSTEAYCLNIPYWLKCEVGVKGGCLTLLWRLFPWCLHYIVYQQVRQAPIWRHITQLFTPVNPNSASQYFLCENHAVSLFTTVWYNWWAIKLVNYPVFPHL